MSSLYRYLNGRKSCDDDWMYSGRNSVQVSEVWEQQVGDALTYSCTTKELEELQLISWLGTPGRDSSPGQSGTLRTRRLRVIWIPRLVENHQFDISESLFELVHRTCKHHLAREYCKTSSAGIGYVPSECRRDTVQHFSYHTKITFTRSSAATHISGTWICIAELPKIHLLQDLINQEFAQRICGHPAAAVLLCSILFSIEIEEIQGSIKTQVRAVEVRTGHHDWKSRKETPALGDLIALAAKMSGCDSRIASCLRKQKMLTEMINFVAERSAGGQSEPDANGEDRADMSRDILEVLEPLKLRARAQHIDTEFIQRRVRTQLEALYHLVAQNDALAAQEMSQDCKLLATASQHDSFSMKCIAVVTMFFLPGTFVSSLLSMPLFDFAADTTTVMYRASYWKPRLVVFLALTFPLMSLTFGIWGFWTLIHHGRQRRSISMAKAQLARDFFENETRVLSSKRRSLGGQN